MSNLLRKELENLHQKTSLLKSQATLQTQIIEGLEAKIQDIKHQHQEEQQRRESAEEKAKYFELEYDRLKEAYLQSQRDRFGKKSERFVDEGELQQPLFGTPKTTTEPNDIEEITYKRPKSTLKSKQNPDTAGIPNREMIIPVAHEDRVCSGCGKDKDVIGHECSQRLNYQSAVFEIVTEKREKMACRKGCEGQLVTAPLTPRILPKCRATESLLSYICVSKVLDRQPLYHLEKTIEQRHHWNIPRQTMARWMIQMADKLQPLVNLMKDLIVEYDIASIDATSLQVLHEPGKSPETKSYAYCLRGGPPGKSVILYEYNAYSQGSYVDETLTDFKGVLQCDASPVFNKIGKQPNITLSYCHAHARRKFEQIEKSAKKGKAPLATEALRIYNRLYAVEREIKEQNVTSHPSPTSEKGVSFSHALRQEKSRPILEEFYTWLTLNQGKTLPKSPIGQAIAYVLNHWEGLQVYLTDGRVEIDNNATEREIKPFVIARKNFLFACTQAGADALGVHFSLILTARLHGFDPMAYYTELLKRIPHCSTFEEYEALLPWNFKMNR